MEVFNLTESLELVSSSLIEEEGSVLTKLYLSARGWFIHARFFNLFFVVVQLSSFALLRIIYLYQLYYFTSLRLKCFTDHLSVIFSLFNERKQYIFRNVRGK